MDQDNRATLERTLEATFRSDFEAAGLAMADDAVVEWPQSGERIVGRQACLTVYKNYPGGSPAYQLRRGSRRLWRGDRLPDEHRRVPRGQDLEADRLFRQRVRRSGVALSMGPEGGCGLTAP